MKKLFILGAVLLAAFTLPAQTTNISPPGVTNGVDLLNQDAARLLADLWGDFLAMKPFSTNGTATLQFGGGKNTVTREWIEAVDLTVPVSSNLNVGVLGYHIGPAWGEGALNLSYSGVTTMPGLGKVRSFIGDGAAWEFDTHQLANYAFAGQDKDWTLFKKINAGVGYVVANTSNRKGVDLLFGGHLQFGW